MAQSMERFSVSQALGDIQLPICIFLSPLVWCNVQPTPTPQLLHPHHPGHTPASPKRTCDQKQFVALKFRQINPSWAYLLASLSPSSLVYTVYTVWEVLVHPFGSSQVRKVMHLGKRTALDLWGDPSERLLCCLALKHASLFLHILKFVLV